jgi:CRP/FNR family transcriptional regulator, cyclic AMP receptor protein
MGQLSRGAGHRQSGGMSERRLPVPVHAREAHWLRAMPVTAANVLRRASTVRTYQAGELVFSPSPDPPHIYVLEDGLIRLFRLTPAGEEFTLRYIRPGELFGEMSVVSGRPREGFAQARAASKILRIPRAAFVATLRADNSLLYSVTKTIAGRVIEYQSRAEDLIFLDARRRLARFLLRVATKHRQRDGKGLTVALPLTHAEIASGIGTSRQTVSRFLMELIDAGLVTRSGGQLVLPDPARLEAID